MGKGRAGGSRAPFPRVRGGEVKGEGAAACGAPLCRANAEGWGGGGAVKGGAGGGRERGRPSCAPLPRKRGREGPGVACPRVHGGQGGATGRGAACPCVPLYAKGKGGTGDGEGAASPLPRERGTAAAACPRAARTGEREGAKEGGGTWGGARKGGTTCPRAPPFCAGGVARTGGKGGGGQCRRGKRRGGLTLVRPLSALERGGGQCGGRGNEERLTERLTLVHPCLRANGAARDAGYGGARPLASFDANGNGGGDGRATGGREWGGKVGVACTRAHTLWRKQNVPATYAEALTWQARVASASFPASSSRLLSSPRLPHSRRRRKRAGRRPASRAERGARDTGHTMPLGLPGPPFSPVRGTPFVWVESGHTRARGPRPSPSFPIRAEGRTRPPPPFPLAAALYARKGGTRGTRPPGPSLPPWPRRSTRVEWGRAKARRAERGHARARDPSAPPFPIRAEGVRRGQTAPPSSPSLFAPPRSRGKGAREARHPLAPPLPIRAEGGRTRAHRPASPRRPHPLPLLSSRHPAREARHPPFPPWPRRPIRAGIARACHPRFQPSPFARRPRHPFPLGCAAPYAREGGMRSATPGATLPPFARKGVARGYAAGHLPSPFAAPPGTREKGAREGIRAEWGARGHAAPFAREGAHEAKPTPPPYVSRSGAGAVSVRPRSPRHSTT
ncbi:hypothetical protein EDB84DRAFT_1445290 [Lactarius hengduanensis]|nr:hypothetical protein EDB84DRAFT_1445290 [Lactarius hengduanensis]